MKNPSITLAERVYNTIIQFKISSWDSEVPSYSLDSTSTSVNLLLTIHFRNKCFTRDSVLEDFVGLSNSHITSLIAGRASGSPSTHLFISSRRAPLVTLRI